MDEKQCQALRLNGAQRGTPCGAPATYEVRGKRVCNAHYATMAKDPSRFRDALDARGRKLAREELKRELAEKQFDMFQHAEEIAESERRVVAGGGDGVIHPSDDYCYSCQREHGDNEPGCQDPLATADEDSCGGCGARYNTADGHECDVV